MALSLEQTMIMLGEQLAAGTIKVATFARLATSFKAAAGSVAGEECEGAVVVAAAGRGSLVGERDFVRSCC